jgi:SAM-dependent methyltransferase
VEKISNTLDLEIYQHNREIQQNRVAWGRKPSLRKAYDNFYRAILDQVDTNLLGSVVEIGSGMGNIKRVIPTCITTDLFSNPWIDRVESIYDLTFDSQSISNLILFDVWHHLEHPANALNEVKRVLVRGGKLILMEPSMSLMGRIIYGKFHHEPLGFEEKISGSVAEMSLDGFNRYFAAQSSAHRIFIKKELPELFDGWRMDSVEQITSFAYWGAGGFSGPQLYPDSVYPVICRTDKILGMFPSIFSARILGVMTNI